MTYSEVQSKEVVHNEDGAPLLRRLGRRTVLRRALERLLQQRSEELLAHNHAHIQNSTSQRGGEYTRMHARTHADRQWRRGRRRSAHATLDRQRGELQL